MWTVSHLPLLFQQNDDFCRKIYRKHKAVWAIYLARRKLVQGKFGLSEVQWPLLQNYEDHFIPSRDIYTKYEVSMEPNPATRQPLGGCCSYLHPVVS